MQSEDEGDDSFSRMEKAMKEMCSALARLPGPEEGLSNAALLIEYQTKSEDILEELTSAIEGWREKN